ncbi:MAG TPA: cytochrome o ubiquinol oxidase subunit IV [Candidatus Saccharimonadales bacterium]|nr:cytochrome o ubiquinol oxidase subunit IV [Candidatus Saccharimonadales bacterium]
MSLHDTKTNDNRSLISYSVGYVSSIILTLVAYALVVNQIFAVWTTVFIISGLAVVQLLIQLMFFLHLGQEARPRWKLMVMLFTLVILVIIVAGSLWIMFDLDSRMMMTPEEMIKYMNRQTGI